VPPIRRNRPRPKQRSPANSWASAAEGVGFEPYPRSPPTAILGHPHTRRTKREAETKSHDPKQRSPANSWASAAEGVGFEPTEVLPQRFSRPFGAFLESRRLAGEYAENHYGTTVFDYSSSLVISRRFASFFVLPRPQRAPRCEGLLTALTPRRQSAEGSEGVFPEQTRWSPSVVWVLN
jgi:hypothetical protein